MYMSEERGRSIEEKKLNLVVSSRSAMQKMIMYMLLWNEVFIIEKKNANLLLTFPSRNA